MSCKGCERDKVFLTCDTCELRLCLSCAQLHMCYELNNLEEQGASEEKAIEILKGIIDKVHNRRKR